MNIFSAQQLYEADTVTTKKQGITSTDLMERAATQIFNWLHQRMQGAQVPIHIFCGIGNNGGDGLALGRLLIENGYNVTMYVANFTDKRSKCFLINYGRVKDITTKWPVLMTKEEDFPVIHPDDIIVDALFGIGLNRAPEGWVKKLIQYLNNQKAFRLAIDIPSGLSANSAVLDPEAILQANHTLTFQTPKLSFFLPDSGKYVPYFEALDIGLDPTYLMTTKPLARMVVKPMAQSFYKQREKYAHKGNFGHALLIGGSKGKMGAMVLATKAALRSGVGLATAYVPEVGEQILQISVPEAMTASHKEEVNFITTISETLDGKTIGIGPGMGQDPKTFKAFSKLLSNTKRPMVIDADAINLLAANPSEIDTIPAGSILTPHVGELKRLLGDWKDDFEKLEKAKSFASKFQVILVLKGANTMCVFGEEIYINTTGNPGMATAGSGDVLTGIITGLLAQGYDPHLAAIFGVYIHGSAGNIVTASVGFEALLASDIIEALGDAFVELFRKEEIPPTQEQKA